MDEIDPLKVRRNSIAASTIMAGYYLVGADITIGKSAKLLGVELDIGRPEYLVYIAWIITIFLFARYWQKRDQSKRNEYHEKLFEGLILPQLNRHIRAVVTGHVMSSRVPPDSKVELKFYPRNIKATFLSYKVVHIERSEEDEWLDDDRIPWRFSAWDMPIHRLKFFILHPYQMDLFLGEIAFGLALVSFAFSLWVESLA